MSGIDKRFEGTETKTQMIAYIRAAKHSCYGDWTKQSLGKKSHGFLRKAYLEAIAIQDQKAQRRCQRCTVLPREIPGHVLDSVFETLPFAQYADAVCRTNSLCSVCLVKGRYVKDYAIAALYDPPRPLNLTFEPTYTLLCPCGDDISEYFCAKHYADNSKKIRLGECICQAKHIFDYSL